MTDRESPPAAPPLALIIALLAAAGGGGFVAYRIWGAHASTLTPIQYPGAVRSAPLPSDSEGSGAPTTARKIPESLPEVAMPDTRGVLHKLSQWRGQPLMVNFWATWCEPCRREIPLLKSLRRERAGESLEIVGVAVDFRDAVIQYTRTIGIDYPVLIGEKDGMAAIDAFGMDTVFPFTVFADRQGRIFTVKVGELHRAEANIILDALREVDAGRLGLTAARQRIAAQLSAQDTAASERGSSGSSDRPQS